MIFGVGDKPALANSSKGWWLGLRDDVLNDAFGLLEGLRP